MKTRWMHFLTVGAALVAAASATFRTLGAQEVLLPCGSDDALHHYFQRDVQEEIRKRSARAEVSTELAAYDFLTARRLIEPVDKALHRKAAVSRRTATWQQPPLRDVISQQKGTSS